jgi:hypothetical protein
VDTVVEGVTHTEVAIGPVEVGRVAGHMVEATDLVEDMVAAIGPVEVGRVADPIACLVAAVMAPVNPIGGLRAMAVMAAHNHMATVLVKANPDLMVGTAYVFSFNTE